MWASMNRLTDILGVPLDDVAGISSNAPDSC